VRALEPLTVTRIVATPAAIDAVTWPAGVVRLRLAPDELLVTGDHRTLVLADPHAIVEPDGGWYGAWIPEAEAAVILGRTCPWAVPAARPVFAQGAVADLPVKLWLETDRVLVLTPAPYAADLAERLS